MESYSTEALKSTFAQYWDGRSTSFDTQPQHVSQSHEETAAWKDILDRLGASQPGLSVLDVGTGTGFLAFLLANMGHRVVGIDVSSGMLAKAREKEEQLGCAVSFQEADAEHTGFPDETFDLVISRHVIWNLPQPDLAIAEWVRITRPGGVVGVINGIFSVRKDPKDRWEEPYRSAFEHLPMAIEGVPPERVASLMRENGLVEVRTEWLNALAAIKRRTLPNGPSYSDNQRYLVAGTKPMPPYKGFSQETLVGS